MAVVKPVAEERAHAELKPVDEGLQQRFSKHFSEEQIVELALTVCVASFTNRVNDSLRSDPNLG